MKPNQPYLPIDCHFYDRIEAAILYRKPVQLEYLDAQNRPIAEETLLLDTEIREGEEFVVLGSGLRLRMDRIVSMDGMVLKKQCD